MTRRAIFAWPGPAALFQAIGAANVQRRAAEGDGEALWSLGYKLVCDAGEEGTNLGAAGRSPEMDVGLALSNTRFQVAHTTEETRCACAVIRRPNDLFAGSNPTRIRVWRFWRRRRGKVTRTLWMRSELSTTSGRNMNNPSSGSPRQGLTLFNFSAQLEPCLTHTKHPTHLKHPLTPP
jgi:hypothetical protein